MVSDLPLHWDVPLWCQTDLCSSLGSPTCHLCDPRKSPSFLNLSFYIRQMGSKLPSSKFL